METYILSIFLSYIIQYPYEEIYKDLVTMLIYMQYPHNSFC